MFMLCQETLTQLSSPDLVAPASLPKRPSPAEGMEDWVAGHGKSPNRKDLTGIRFSRLVALYPAGNYKKKLTWMCQCDCGRQKIIIGCNLSSGGSKSCGCPSTADKTPKRVCPWHGAHRGMYRVWYGMKSRCADEGDKNYGGAGIKVCANLYSSPLSIIEAIGLKPKSDKPRGYSIDRINNGGHYSCGQCEDCKNHGWPINIRWATQSQQMRNVGYNRKIEINGITRCAAEWAEVSGLKYACFLGRVMRGECGQILLRPSRGH